jgi:nicotinamidase-related amidase
MPSLFRNASSADQAAHVLGAGRYSWAIGPGQVDLSMPPPTPLNATIDAMPLSIEVDLRRSAMIVVDMQNNFCAPGGLSDHLGVDLTPERAPIPPLKATLPVMRSAEVPIIWLNWGNRPDRKNLPPVALYAFNRDGLGPGIGGALPDGRGRILEKGSWSAAIVDELEPGSDDILVDKYRVSGFWDTPLDSILRNLDVKTIFFAGVNLDLCVFHTLADAHFLGYNCVLVEDCCGTTSPDFCVDATLWNIKKCFGFVTQSDALRRAVRAEVPEAAVRVEA